MMKRIGFTTVFALIVMTSVCAVWAADAETIVERSLGKLILVHDTKRSHIDGPIPFVTDRLYYEDFLPIYEENIRELPAKNRVDFLWTAMWHLGFDGHLMEELQAIITQDCEDEFISRLQNYVDQERAAEKSSNRLYLSEKVLADLKLKQGN